MGPIANYPPKKTDGLEREKGQNDLGYVYRQTSRYI